MTSIIEELNKRFGDIVSLSISRGKVHDYVGMAFDYTTKGNLVIAMYDYINSIIKNASQIYKESAGSVTPAPDHLYEIRDTESENHELLFKAEREEYHTTTAQCLYLSKRGKPDIQQYVVFQCAKVNNPTKNNQKKLAEIIKYLIVTIQRPLIQYMNEHGVS